MGSLTRDAAVMLTDAAEFHDALVLHRTDFGWLCDIEGCRVFVARFQVASGTTMPREGERGTVTIAGYAATDIRRALSDRRNTI
jgi:hypothetical protein